MCFCSFDRANWKRRSGANFKSAALLALFSVLSSAPASCAHSVRAKEPVTGMTSPETQGKPVKNRVHARPETTDEIYEQSWALLEAGSQSENLRKRTDVIAALSSMQGDRRAVHLLEAALDDKQSAIRRDAASALGSMGASDAIPYLKRAMDDKDAGVSFAAAEALWKMGDRDGATIFYAVVLGNRHVAKGFVSSNITTARRELHDPMALANIGIDEASGALLGPFAEGITIARELAKDRSAPARALSATLLGEYPNPDSEKILGDTLVDKNVAVRAAVAKALGGFNDPALIERLAPLLSEKGTPLIKPVTAVRFMAAAAIIRLHNHEGPDRPLFGPPQPRVKTNTIPF